MTLGSRIIKSVMFCKVMGVYCWRGMESELHSLFLDFFTAPRVPEYTKFCLFMKRYCVSSEEYL